jgi:hypothetical protein
VQPPLRRLGLIAAVLFAAGSLSPIGRDGALAGGLAIGWALAGVGLAIAFAWLLRSEERWRAAAAALVAAGVLGPPAFRAWRGGTPRAEIERPPALVVGLGEAPEVRPRIAWPDRTSRPYRDGPPDTAARFGYAYLPGTDGELTRLWRASSGAGERLLDLFDVEYLLVPASVATPAALEVVGAAGRGDWVLARNPERRPRAFVAPAWSWHRDPDALARELFPAAPDQRSHAALGTVRLIGSGAGSPPATGPQPAPACRIDAPRPEAVDLTCRSPSGGYAVLLDRHAPGWTATVDGREVAIERADLLARAVKVGPGEHHIRFRYRAPGLRLSLAVSGLAWLVLLGLAAVLRRAAR